MTNLGNYDSTFLTKPGETRPNMYQVRWINARGMVSWSPYYPDLRIAYDRMESIDAKQVWLVCTNEQTVYEKGISGE